ADRACAKRHALGFRCHSDVSIDLDPHLVRQGDKRDVERGSTCAPVLPDPACEGHKQPSTSRCSARRASQAERGPAGLPARKSGLQSRALHMKILGISDIHNNLACVRKLRAQETNEYDVIAVAGDIGTRAAGEIFATLASFECPIVYVHGNWDRMP